MASRPLAYHKTFTLHRSFSKSQAHVYETFIDSRTRRLWIEGAGTQKLEKLICNFRVGGFEIIRSRFNASTPYDGATLEINNSYMDIVAPERIVMTENMLVNGQRISVSLVTIEVEPNLAGAQLHCTQQATYLTGDDGSHMQGLGWCSYLDSLKEDL